MLIDHSLTYKQKSFRNLPHKLRLSAICALLDGCGLTGGESYADYGCSNGYITDLIARRYSISRAYGFDYEAEHVAAAGETYPAIQFRSADLNDPIPDGPFDLITCFETLEHVGHPGNALRKLLASCNDGGRIVITVPVETGLVGLIKFLLKVTVYSPRYRSDLEDFFKNQSVYNYMYRLIQNRDISTFRDERSRWGTHWGFDFRVIDRFLEQEGTPYKSWRSGTTRFYLIIKSTKACDKGRRR